MFCLSKGLSAEFKKRLVKGEIDPAKLSVMSSAERREFFSSFMGEANAKEVNTLFESKLLLKDQQKAMISWAKQIAGMKPEVLKDIVSRVEKMTNILNPKDQDAFLEDLASHKLGTTVTMEEAAKISDLAKDVSEAKGRLDKGEDRLAYGRARVKFDNYINGLKHESEKTPLKEYLYPKNYGKAISNVAGLGKALKASLDNSALGRQGLKTLITHPGIWYKNAIQSFSDIWNTFGGKEVMDEVRSDVLSRPNAINGLYKKEGLAVGVRDEAYPTSLPEKLPFFVGKAFKASEAAYQGFLYRTRADLFDKLVDIAQKSGGDIEGLGKLVNSMTGRGSLGPAEPAANAVNNLFFSPRFVKANFDTLTGHLLSKDMGSFSKKQAAINLLKIVSAIAAVLAIAKSINKNTVELDPRSADFGKIKVGNTRFDITGGMGSLVILAARLLSRSSKSSITHNVTKLDSGKYGSMTGMDVVYNFFEGKLSPAAGVARDLIKGKDYQGNKVTALGEANNLATPLGITNYMELKNDPNSADVLSSMILDGLGIATNTYNSNVDWSQNPGKELKQFYNKVGDEKFKEANSKFNERYGKFLDEMGDNPKYKNISDDERQAVVTKEKAQLKSKIFNEYHFYYHR